MLEKSEVIRMLLKVQHKLQDGEETVYYVQDQDGKLFYLTDNVSQDLKEIELVKFPPVED